MGEARKVVGVGNEFGLNRRAFVIELPAKGKASHRPVDLEKEALKHRLKDAMRTIVRLAREKESGADMRAALSQLQAKTITGKIAELASGSRGRGHGVSEADMDRLEETLGWVERYVPDPSSQHLLLDWARGLGWQEIVGLYGGSQATLWRRIDKLLNDILYGLRIEHTKGLNR